MVFYKKNWFSSGIHLDTVRGGKKSSDSAENYFGGTYRCISEVVLSVFGNLASFSFYKEKVRGGFPEILFCDTKNRINPDGEIKNEKGQNYL
jgi:hypothetical protein